MAIQKEIFPSGVIWVGGFGFLCFAYPSVVCRITRQEPTPERLRLFKIMGAVELIAVYLSAVGIVISGFFSS